MLYVVNVESKKGFGSDFETGKKILLNTEGFLKMQVKETLKSDLLYEEKLFSKEVASLYRLTEAVGNLEDAVGEALNNAFLDVTVFDDPNDLNTSSTHTWLVKYIRKGFDEYSGGSATGRSYIYVQEGLNINKYLVDHTIQELRNLAINGTATIGTISSAVVENAAPTDWVFTVSRASNPTLSGFTLYIDGTEATIASVSGLGTTTITITTSETVANGETLTYDYSGNEFADVTGGSVTNNVA